MLWDTANCPGCNEQFDAEIAFKSLRKRYQQISAILVNYMDEAGIDRPTRNMLAQKKKDDLIRIIGGKETDRFPQTCLIGSIQQAGAYPIPRWFCSGILVHERLVLTAAHCYSPDHQYVVAINATHQNDLDDAVEIKQVKKALVNEYYFQTKKYHDISALILREPSTIAPISIATSEEINSAEEVTLAGFGNSDRNSTVGFGIKREVNVPIMSILRDRSTDLSEEEYTYGFEADLEFVAGGGGFDSCSGDSGGPAFIKVGGEYKLAGLTSRATLTSDFLCGDGGIYTRVDQQRSWINSILDFDFI